MNPTWQSNEILWYGHLLKVNIFKSQFLVTNTYVLDYHSQKEIASLQSPVTDFEHYIDNTFRDVHIIK